MSKPVVIVLVVEFLLITFTVLLLLRPNGLFGSGVEKKKAFSAWSGLLLLFFTFINSIITGIVLAMNDFYLPW